MPILFNQRLAVLILIFITILVFSPCLQLKFTNWDDQELITQNQIIKEFNGQTLSKIFDFKFITYFPPLTMTSFALEYQLGQLNPFIYHFDNLLLHVLNVILVFMLIKLLTNEVLVAFLAALLFSINPMRVESVAWVVERKDLLYAFFYLLALIFYIQKKNLACFCCFIFSVLSKVQGLTLPFSLIVVDLYLNRSFSWRFIVEKWSYYIICIIFSLFIIYGQWPHFQNPSIFDFWQKMLLSANALIIYIVKSFIPYQLSILYPFPEIKDLIPLATCYLSLLLCIGWGVLIYQNRIKHPIFATGSIFFIINIVMAILNIMLVGNFINDRFSYLASVGLYWVVAIALVKCFSNQLNKIVIIIVVGYVLMMGYITFNRCYVWYDGVTLWSDLIKQSPNLFLSYDNRARIYMEKGQLELALTDLNKTIELNPNLASAYLNRAMIYDQWGKTELAQQDFDRAILLDHKYSNAFYNRAIFYLRHGQKDKAQADFNIFKKAQTTP